MKTFLKQNYVLVCGIAMPIILAVVFFVATRVPTDGALPQTPVVFVTGDFTNYWHFEVNHNTVYVSYTKPDRVSNCCASPVIHIFNPVTKSDRTIDPPIFKNGQDLTGVAVPELKDIKVDPSAISPDGFNFERDEMNDDNFITLLFGGGGNSWGSGSKYVLLKGHTRVAVPSAPRFDTHFIGWVVK